MSMFTGVREKGEETTAIIDPHHYDALCKPNQCPWSYPGEKEGRICDATSNMVHTMLSPRGGKRFSHIPKECPVSRLANDLFRRTREIVEAANSASPAGEES